MYTPRHFELPESDISQLLASAQTAQLVTAHEAGPVATLLPLTYRPDLAGVGLGSLIFHVTRVNPVWKEPHLGDALAILSGPEGYIHPDWYPSNAERPGVPTWNYVTVHAYGPLVVRDDPDWLHEAAMELSDRFGYDSRRVDAEALARMMRAIVGLELPITRVEAKAKLNQNRSSADVAGVIDGLRAGGGEELAAEMERLSLPHARAREELIAEVRHRNLGQATPAKP